MIKNTNERLILISPYLQFHNRIRDHIQNLNVQKKDIRIVYRESKLQLEESNWLESQIGVRTSVCPTLHAKCYLNESEAIVTSMNLYSFSQQNNDEMGIYVKKDEDPELYDDIFKEVQRLLTISEEIRVSVKKVEKKDDHAPGNIERPVGKKINFSNSKYRSTSALSKKIGISSKELFEIFENKNWITKNGKSWILTPKGEDNGGEMKKGQYGEFVAWPEEIVNILD